jgi:putative FmdB family regulatory protein
MDVGRQQAGYCGYRREVKKSVPIYEYRCEKCGQELEKLVLSISQPPVEVICPGCDSTDVQRLISAPSIHVVRGEEPSTDAKEAPVAELPVFGRKELQETRKGKDRK